jgi:hypothetical protein
MGDQKEVCNDIFMTFERRRVLLTWLWIGIGVQVVGQVVDLRWHATHAEFEGAAEQLEAHWMLWIGGVVTLAAAMVGTRMFASRWYLGFSLLLLVTVAYALVSVWHFWEHMNERDPDLPHVLLGITKIGMLAGAVSATLEARADS